MVSLQGGVGGHKSHVDHIDNGSLGDGGLVLKETTELASQKHALSERKRRKRINAHYDSLRQFFPRLHKADKASVLSETVRHLKEIKNMIPDISPSYEDKDRYNIGNKLHHSFFMPGENDEVTVNYFNNDDKITVRALICCEDRLDLNRGFNDAVQSVRGKVVRVEIATVGGRIKAEVVVELLESSCGVEEDVGLLRRMLKAVVENRVLGSNDFMGRGFAKLELIGSSRRLNLYDQIENGYTDGLVVRSF